jgi:hypothetical protein
VTINKGELMQQLQTARDQSVAALALVHPDWEQVIHADSGWTVKDLIWHITAWELEMDRGLKSWSQGATYLMADLDGDQLDDYNALIRERRQNDSAYNIRRDWEACRLNLMHTLANMHPSRLEALMTPPWGGKEIEAFRLIYDAIEHEREHLDEIVKAVS